MRPEDDAAPVLSPNGAPNCAGGAAASVGCAADGVVDSAAGSLILLTQSPTADGGGATIANKTRGVRSAAGRASGAPAGAAFVVAAAAAVAALLAL